MVGYEINTLNHVLASDIFLCICYTQSMDLCNPCTDYHVQSSYHTADLGCKVLICANYATCRSLVDSQISLISSLIP